MTYSVEFEAIEMLHKSSEFVPSDVLPIRFGSTGTATPKQARLFQVL